MTQENKSIMRGYIFNFCREVCGSYEDLENKAPAIEFYRKEDNEGKAGACFDPDAQAIKVYGLTDRNDEKLREAVRGACIQFILFSNGLPWNKTYCYQLFATAFNAELPGGDGNITDWDRKRTRQYTIVFYFRQLKKRRG